MVTPRFLLKKSLTVDQVTIKKTTNESLIMEPEIEQQVRDDWIRYYNEAKTAGKNVWDGESYRLESFTVEDDMLHLVVSRIPFSIRYPLNRIIQHSSNEIPYEKYVRGLSVGGLLQTSDNFFIFGKRGNNTLTESRIDFIGGILEELEPPTGHDLFQKILRKYLKKPVSRLIISLIGRY